MKTYSIEKAENGYILQIPHQPYSESDVYLYKTLEETLQRLADAALQQFEGKTRVLHRRLYGDVTVTINYEEPEEHKREEDKKEKKQEEMPVFKCAGCKYLILSTHTYPCSMCSRIKDLDRYEKEEDGK